MTWWIWILFIFFGLGFIAAISEEKSSKKAAKPANKSARDIADEIDSPAKYKALERKLETAIAKLQCFNGSDKAYDDLSDKVDLLQEAMNITNSKIICWQFVPTHDLETPLYILEAAYNIFSLQDYPQAKERLGKQKEHWYGIRGTDEPYEKDPEIPFLIKFRKIVENSSLSREETIKKINLLVNQQKEAAGDFFDPSDKNENPGQQWFNDHM